MLEFYCIDFEKTNFEISPHIVLQDLRSRTTGCLQLHGCCDGWW